ncbi:MAG: ABC transporter ATP-binding protein [Gammaproteobacteria bacterium]|nr:ABC transporter ATP-binding protein [Gammaproteobacteria bacterium]NIR85015.1 ABC transporter ATP-binding protein [Gammaproteobacteria bacterium]NIR88282.1 ABC transporter ATP-binding protein [Gammaproteobacteria bacterium]NIU06062.1 ABC transporter ATP-binding protein [Gammaproteobacteria bacterium]NIV73481.1 ATP-binding cassette domain-containing protein [Gammaproteobacteria bacterium]
MESVIRVDGVSQRFGAGAGAVDALIDIDFHVGPHEFVSIVGPSGCGKTTVLRIVAGLLAPSAGEIRIHGQPVRGPHPTVGIVFQRPVLLPWRSVRANIELQMEMRNLHRNGYRERTQELIDLAGLQGFEERLPHELSGGMQQRVSLCRALVHDPELLLMDEPFGALDAMTRELMNMELQRIWMEQRKTVLFITHSISEAVLLSDRVLVMTPRPGRIARALRVEIPRPRDLSAMQRPEFLDIGREVRRLLDAAGTLD